MLTITDLFIVGLGLDIAGAVLLAKGLLLDTPAIAALGTWNGVGFGATVERCRDRVHAEIGLSALGFGFLFQAVGYGAILSGARQASGASEVVAAAALTVFAVAGVALFWWRSQEPRLKRLLVAVALATPKSHETDEEYEGGWTNPRTMLLINLAKAAGWPPEAGDHFDQGVDVFVWRVFGVRVPRFLPMPEVLDR